MTLNSSFFPQQVIKAILFIYLIAVCNQKRNLKNELKKITTGSAFIFRI